MPSFDGEKKKTRRSRNFQLFSFHITGVFYDFMTYFTIKQWKIIKIFFLLFEYPPVIFRSFTFSSLFFFWLKHFYAKITTPINYPFFYRLRSYEAIKKNFVFPFFPTLSDWLITLNIVLILILLVFVFVFLFFSLACNSFLNHFTVFSLLLWKRRELK